MSGQILFTDLDDTLLNDRKEVTPGSRRAIEAALARGVKVTGATVHYVDSGMDTGPIILGETALYGDLMLSGVGENGEKSVSGIRRPYFYGSHPDDADGAAH